MPELYSLQETQGVIFPNDIKGQAKPRNEYQNLAQPVFLQETRWVRF